MTPQQTDQKLLNTAKLVVHLGWGGEDGVRGKPVVVARAPSNHQLSVEIVREAYRLGARNHLLVPLSPETTALHLAAHRDNPEARNEILKPYADAWNMLVDSHGCTVRVEAPDFPLALKECDQSHVSQYEVASYNARKHFYENGLFAKTLPWTLIPRATAGWAEMIFPSDPEGMVKLQEALDTILEVSHSDCVERWQKRAERMEKRGALLDQIGIEELKFAGPDTELVVGLSPLARFSSALKTTSEGVRHMANIPTYENYSTPDWRKTRGHVAMTRPVLISGTLVKGLHIWFNENGEVERFEAREGAKAFEALISNPGANRLGEVALVGIDDSKIFQSGLVFQNTLLDENASCHIAFGQAYPSQLEGGTAMSDEQKDEVGCNRSEKHEDMMISDESTSVTAISRAGEEVEIIKKGKWAGAFAL